VGLMLQRLVTATVLVHGAVTHLDAASPVGFVGPQIIDAVAGMLLLVGLWTPVVGTIVTSRELLVLSSGGGDPWMPLVLATLGATLAMIGPGAWSIDARLFGRRQIQRLR
jgi:putative oxidoreductase